MGKKEGEWAKAFLGQAKEDFIAAQRLLPIKDIGEHEIQAPSAFVMLIQMVIEKIGKSACLQKGYITEDYKQHPIASRFLQIYNRTRHGGRIDNIYFPHIKKIIIEIENGLPSRESNRPQLEYPWIMPDGKIGYPAKDLPIAQRMRNPECPDGPRLVKFITWLFENFDSLFH